MLFLLGLWGKEWHKLWVSVCADIFCCWAHSLLPTSHCDIHHIIALWECRPSDLDKILHSLVYSCECVAGYQCRLCILLHSGVSSDAYLNISIHTSFTPVLRFPTLLSMNHQRTRENLKFIRHTYILSHKSQLSDYLILKLPYHILIVMDSRIALCDGKAPSQKSGISFP